VSYSNIPSKILLPSCQDHIDLWQKFIQHNAATSIRDPHLGIKQIVGKYPGPHICFTAAVHGNEPVGVKAFLHLLTLAQEIPILTRGTLSLIIGNPLAFQKGVRYIEEDLNRSFNHKLTSSIEGQRAGLLRRFFREKPVDFVLDLHSVSIKNFQITVYPKNCSLWAGRLGLLSVHFAYQHEHMSGLTLIDEIIRGYAYSHQGSPNALVIECGGHQVPQATEVALAHIKRVLSYFEMISDECKTQLNPDFTSRVDKGQSIKIYSSLDVIRPQAGFNFTQDVETGTCMVRDEAYAMDASGQCYKQNYADQAWLMMPSRDVSDDDLEAGWWCHLEESDLETFLKDHTPL
jgi:succinylglutamate desuccinylase